MSLGLVVLEKKLFSRTRTRTPTPQSDDIKMSKKVTWASVYGPHTHVKCLLKALIFGTCEKDIIMHSQMGFQLNQSHSLTVTGLKGGKKSKYWVSVGLLEISMWFSN